MAVEYGMSTCIGEVITGLKYPVFYDPHYPGLINRPPVTLVTGAPGSGKTFFGSIVASHASILSKKGYILDPKGDFVSLKNMERAGLINNVHVWSVLSENGEVLDENVGMLDPTTFSNNPANNTALTIDTITLLVGSVTDKQKTELVPIVRDIVELPNPSFKMVITKLLSNRNDEIRSLGYALDTLLETPLAKLLVANRRATKRTIASLDGLVVVNLMGLSIPLDTKPRTDYTSDEKLSVVIMGMLSSMVLDLMWKEPVETYKVLIIDEAWSIMATATGRAMVQQVARLGRSKNLAAILLTQSPKHLEQGEQGAGDMDTMISVRFAFRNNDDKDNITTCRSMRLSEEEPWEELIPTLETGECLMQDANFQVSIVAILAPEDWGETFNTNPIKRKQAQEAKEAEEGFSLDIDDLDFEYIN